MLHSVTYLDIIEGPQGFEILAISRKEDLTDWNLPGGKIEAGETLLEAVIRETLEEVGRLPGGMSALTYADHAPGAETKAEQPVPVFRQLCRGEVNFFNTTFMARKPIQTPEDGSPLHKTREGTVQRQPLEVLLRETCSFRDHNEVLFRTLGFL